MWIHSTFPYNVQIGSWAHLELKVYLHYRFLHWKLASQTCWTLTPGSHFLPRSEELSLLASLKSAVGKLGSIPTAMPISAVPLIVRKLMKTVLWWLKSRNFSFYRKTGRLCRIFRMYVYCRFIRKTVFFILLPAWGRLTAFNHAMRNKVVLYDMDRWCVGSLWYSVGKWIHYTFPCNVQKGSWAHS